MTLNEFCVGKVIESINVELGFDGVAISFTDGTRVWLNDRYLNAFDKDGNRTELE